MKTISHTPVTIPTSAFTFCRFGSAILVWLAWYLASIPLTLAITLMFFIASIVGVAKSPLVFLYTNTIERLFPSKLELVDASAIRFAHGLATILATVCLILLLIYQPAGVVALFCFAILKTITALGFCPAAKLHGCLMSGGTCCAFLKKRKKQ